MYIFISHASKDAEMAEKICAFLEGKGKNCFLAPRDIPSGREYAEEIINGIDRSTAMILVMSEHANESPHVLREVERAVSKRIPILVYKLEEVTLSKSMEYFLMTHQWLVAKPQEDFAEIWTFLQDNAMQKDADVTQKMGETEEAIAEEQAKARVPMGGPWGKKKLTLKTKILLLALIVGLLAAAVIADRVFREKHPEDTGTQTEQGADATQKETDETGKEATGEAGTEPEITPEAFVCPYELGDTITFGTYNGEPIEWRVLKLSEDETQAVLVAKQILTMKAYDAAESGAYNKDGDKDYWTDREAVEADLELQLRVHGNNDWSVSNIRTWLNSEKEVVQYADQPPMSSAMCEKRNGYHNEAGFLHDFTDEELAAIVLTTNETAGNALAGGTITTEDKVYLLSREELVWFDAADISKLAIPTEQAVEKDESYWYHIDLTEFKIEEFAWWLRDPVEGTTSGCYMVGNGYTAENILNANVGLEGYGIRPAVTVDLQAECFATE